MKYYPSELKYEVETYGIRGSDQQILRKRDQWQTSILLTWIVTVHLCVIYSKVKGGRSLSSSVIVFAITVYLLSNKTLSPTDPSISTWATFLGVSSAILAAIQYAPQLAYTFDIKLVGALSIPMMMIQTPGAILMVLSIALRYWITLSNELLS
jgi:hypothetical protein